MSDTPIPANGTFELNAVDKFVQMAWDRFAARGSSDNVEADRSDETRDVSAGDDEERDSDVD